MKQSRPVIAALVVLLFACPAPAFAQTTKPKPKPKPKPSATVKAPPPEVQKPPPPPSVTVTTRYSAGGEAIVTTVHSSGSRQRFEFVSGRTLIVQCDVKKAIQISDLAKSYVVDTLGDATAHVPAGPAGDSRKGGPVAFQTVITDTGERREMFGLQARRVTVVTTREPSAIACDKSRTRMETDGWYADLPVAMQCGAAEPVAAASKPECADAALRESTGPASALGYPISYTTTTTDDGGKPLSTVAMEATALTLQPVDPPNYDVPAGYAEVKDAQELARAELVVKGEQPKGVGVVRIGIVLPRNSSGASVESGAIGNELLDALSTHPYEPLPLDATEPADVDAEAKRKDCDFVLFTDLTTAKTSAVGRIGGLMNRVSKSDAKENHEAKLQYRLVAPGKPKPVVEKTASAKTGAALNVRTVLNVARLAARLYFGMSGGVMRAMLANANGGAAAADPMTGALNMVMTLGAPSQPPADSLEGIILTALHTQSADVMKAIGR
jgi:hypothetical protein